MLNLLLGRSNGLAAAPLLALLARLLGRLVDVAGISVMAVFATPKDHLVSACREDLLSTASCSPLAIGPPILLMRFLPLRTVIEAEMLLPSADARGEDLGVVFEGGGNFDRTECTLSSIFCIRPIRPLI